MSSSEKKAEALKTQEAGRDSFFREVLKEMTKITWTTKKELIMMTKVVLASIFVFGFSIFFADVIIQKVMHIILKAGIKLVG